MINDAAWQWRWNRNTIGGAGGKAADYPLEASACEGPKLGWKEGGGGAKVPLAHPPLVPLPLLHGATLSIEFCWKKDTITVPINFEKPYHEEMQVT